MALVNGIEPAWSQAVFTVAGIVIFGITKIEYKEVEAKENLWGAGSRPVARSSGKIEATGSITLHSSEVERLQSVAPFGDIKEIPPFDITVTMAALNPGGLPIRHKLRNCEFTSNMRSMSAGDMVFSVDLDLVIEAIDYV